MNPQLYSVKLVDLSTYEVTVAADSPNEAQSIAKSALNDEASTLPDGMRLATRELDATAIEAKEQPIRMFRVAGTFSVDFVISVPASTREEAERHARRLYMVQPFPWEHETVDERVHWHAAREVVA